MYFLWSERKNKLHFSIFWESVVYRLRKTDVSGLVSLQKCTLNTDHSFTITFERLVKLILPKDHAEVMQGAGVKLHPEHHISTRRSEALVIALELTGGGERKVQF